MDHSLARRRGLNATFITDRKKAGIEKTHDGEILFFRNMDELCEELELHEWKADGDRGNGRCWKLEGCPIQIWTYPNIGRVSIDDLEEERSTSGDIRETFMIMGTLFVGTGVEL